MKRFLICSLALAVSAVPYAQNRTQILNQTSNFFYAELDARHAAQ